MSKIADGLADTQDVVSDEMLLDAFISDPLLWSGEGGQMCWGGLLQGDASGCTIGFRPGPNHFKNKLCPACRQNGVTIPSDRVRALDPSEWQSITDKSRFGTGLWTPTCGGKYQCRLANHTAKCSGPRLLIYRDPPPAAERASWAPMPVGWLGSGEHCMKLVVALGTLRPAVAINPANRVRSITSGLASSAAAAADSAADSAREAEGVPASSESHSDDDVLGSTALEPASKRARALMVCDADVCACEASIDDIDAVRAAVNDESFREKHDDQLRVCSVSLPSLNVHGREVMHEMFCDSMLRALGAAAGEAPVRRVLATFRQHQQRILSTMQAAEATHEINSSTRLAMCCACLHDLETWAALVDAASAGGATGEPVTISAQPPSDWLASFTNSFARVSLDSSWRPCVERSLALQQQMVQTALSGPAHAWTPQVLDSKDARALCNQCFADGHFLGHIDIDVAVDGSACEPQPPTGEAICTEASAILQTLIEEQHGTTTHTFSDNDRLIAFRPSGLLEEIGYWSLFGTSDVTCRCVEERLDDERGCRVVFARWDEAHNRPYCFYEADSGMAAAAMFLFTLTVSYDKEARSWRLAESDFFLPSSQHSLPSALLAHAPSHMMSVVAHLEYRRLQQQFTDIIQQRAQAAKFVV